MNIINKIKRMKFQLTWSKVFLDFYPTDMVQQFKKVSIPFYLSFSLVFFYVVTNMQAIFLSKDISVETVIAFYFVLPILLPFTLICLLISSFHILRHNNPFYLYYINFKHLLLYALNFGMIFFSLLFLSMYVIVINRIFKII